MSSHNTPPFGSSLEAIAALRRDLREHSTKDEVALADLRHDIGSLTADTAEQTGMLRVLHQGITRRAATDQAKEIEAYKSSQQTRGNIIKVVVAAIAGGIVEIAHRIFG